MKRLSRLMRGTVERVEFCDECSEVSTTKARRRAAEDRARAQAMSRIRVG